LVDAGPAPEETPGADAGVMVSIEQVDGGLVLSQRPYRVIVSGGAGWVHGLQPSNSVIGRVGVGLRWPHFSVAVEAALLPSVSKSFLGGEVSTSAWTAGLTPCLHAGPWGGCGLLEVAALNETGSGYAVSTSQTTWIPRLGLRAQWEWVFAAPVGLRLHLDGAANLVRPRLLVDGQSAWQAPAVSVALGGALFFSL
jgi:hypothetical protein